jgi:hypothetical protein
MIWSVDIPPFVSGQPTAGLFFSRNTRLHQIIINRNGIPTFCLSHQLPVVARRKAPPRPLLPKEIHFCSDTFWPVVVDAAVYPLHLSGRRTGVPLDTFPVGFLFNENIISSPFFPIFNQKKNILKKKKKEVLISAVGRRESINVSRCDRFFPPQPTHCALKFDLVTLLQHG